MLAAIGRGMHREWHAPPWILDDAYALPLVGPAWPDYLATLEKLVTRDLVHLAVGFLTLRSRYAEERLESGGFSQYVLLGAGLDSLAWRRPDLLRKVQFCEVDHPTTQAWKQERAAAIGLPEHEHHVFVPVDFEAQDLRDGLDRAGFDWNRPALFSWLGCVMYLTRDAITTTLRTLADAAPGSGVVLTYRPAPEYLDDDSLRLLKAIEPMLEQLGEPFQEGFVPDQFEALVRGCGHVIDDHPLAEELEARYFRDRKDGLRPYSLERILSVSLR